MDDTLMTSCASSSPDHRVSGLPDWNQLLLCRGRTELLPEESGVGPRPTEGDGGGGGFDGRDDVIVVHVL